MSQPATQNHHIPNHRANLRAYRPIETWDLDMKSAALALLKCAGWNDVVALNSAGAALSFSGLEYRCRFYGALVRLLTEGVIAFGASGINVARLRERLAGAELGVTHTALLMEHGGDKDGRGWNRPRYRIEERLLERCL